MANKANSLRFRLKAITATGMEAKTATNLIQNQLPTPMLGALKARYKPVSKNKVLTTISTTRVFLLNASSLGTLTKSKMVLMR